MFGAVNTRIFRCSVLSVNFFFSIWCCQLIFFLVFSAVNTEKFPVFSVGYIYPLIPPKGYHYDKKIKKRSDLNLVKFFYFIRRILICHLYKNSYMYLPSNWVSELLIKMRKVEWWYLLGGLLTKIS